MAAPLPRLRGQFLLLPSLTMRLALLSQGRSAKGAGKKGHRVAEDLMACIIRSSFLRDSIPQGGTGMGMDRLQQQLLHTFCSTVRLLMSSSLMNERGEATGLSGLCSHLFWTEPANFALVALLGSGSLAKLMSSKRDTQSKQNALACVVAHLFERIPIQPNRARRMREEAIETTSSSLVILPKLPKECAQTLSAFNAHVLDTASQCIISFAEALEAQAMQNPGQAAQMQLEDATLPLSGFTHYAPLQQHQQLQQQPHRGADAAPETPRLASLLQPALPVSNTNVWLPAQHSVAACPFACLSGHGDRFCSVAELVGSTKQRICVDASAIPVVDLCDRHGQPYPLNAYVYDFFKHGQPQTITCDNGVLDGDAWESFRSIQGILQAISTSLELIMLDLQKAGGLSGSKDMEMIVTGFKEVLGIFQRKFQAYSSIPPLHGL